MKKKEENLLKLGNQACFPIYALSREIINRYRDALDEIGLTYPQYLVLLILWEEGEQTVNQLGAKLHLDSGTLTPLLKRLEQKHILTRTRSLKDERVVLIALTEEGQKLRENACAVPGKLLEALQINAEDLAELKRISEKILSNKNK